MVRKISPSPQPARPDVRVDYAVIALAAGAAIVALIYLILL
jgi:hypothetical protein